MILPAAVNAWLPPPPQLTSTRRGRRILPTTTSKTNFLLSSSLDDYSGSSSTDPSSLTPPPPEEEPPKRKRKIIAKVEKFTRLPVWPAWNGVLIFIVQRLLGNAVAARLEDRMGGRVCPNFFASPDQTSPFIMLVHHNHSFGKWDVLRWLQRIFILEEGFPAHFHRGFTTVTYILEGNGFVHRDSNGLQQTYGATSSQKKHHTQWLFTGAGLLHEEMFDNHHSDSGGNFEKQELYQLWLNVPAAQKLNPPTVQLLGPNECPVVQNSLTRTVVIAGSHQGMSSQAPTSKPMVDILHVQLLEPGATWSHALHVQQETVILYVRKGRISVDGTVVDVHHTAYLEASSGNDSLLEIVNDNNNGPSDVLVLCGKPLKGEPVVAQGSVVMNTPHQLQQAYADYQRGYMGVPWDASVSNAEWKAHIQLYPCRYPYSNIDNGRSDSQEC